MTAGYFTGLLARARGDIGGIRPHVSARYAGAESTTLEATVQAAARRPEGPPAVRTPAPPTRTPPAMPSPETRMTAGLDPERPAPSANPGLTMQTPQTPRRAQSQPAHRQEPSDAGAALPAMVSADVEGIAGKPAPTISTPMARRVSETAPPRLANRPPRPVRAHEATPPSPVATETAEVHVHIGRVEIVAPPSATITSPVRAAQSSQPPQRPLSLDDYLAGRRRP